MLLFLCLILPDTQPITIDLPLVWLAQNGHHGDQLKQL